MLQKNTSSEYVFKWRTLIIFFLLMVVPTISDLAYIQANSTGVFSGHTISAFCTLDAVSHPVNYVISQMLFLNINYVLSQLLAASLTIQLLITILILLVIGLIFLFLYIFFNRTQKTIKWEREEKTRRLYQNELTRFLYEEDDRYFEFTGLHKANNRMIFIDELLRLHTSLLGESRVKVQALYYDIGLYMDSKNKMDHRLWSIKAKGFRELAQMEVFDAAIHIEKYAYAKNKILRMEAQIALIKLKTENHLDFLTDFTYPLTEWEQINILNTLVTHNIAANSFEELMKSENDTIVAFALKLCSHYNHIHSWGKVLELLDHKNHEVRYHAVKTLDKFNILENKEPLKQFFFRQVLNQGENHDLFKHQKLINNKLATLKALSSLTTWEDAWFYKLILSNPSEDFYVLKAAYEQLQLIVSNAGQMIEDLNTPAFETVGKLKNHFTQNILTK